MKLKNIGKKIVHIGNIALMPGDEKSFPESAVNTPAIQVLCINGFLSIENEPEQKAPAAEEVLAEVTEETPAEKPEAKTASPAKRTAKSKSTAK